MLRKYFITGTGTDVGKTVVSTILTLGLNASYWKPIQSGTSDLQQVKEWTQLPSSHFFPSTYTFKASLSPDQAALRENITIDLDECNIPQTNEALIVEGAGGVFVPLNTEKSLLDLMAKFKLPVVIVTLGTLGTINHTLLTIEMLRQRNLAIHGIVFTGDLNPENQLAIEKWGKVKTLLHVPHFEKIEGKILRAWTALNKKFILENFK